MSRYMFIMECKEGSEQEYKKRHQAVDQELLSALTEVGVSNYSIFMDGTKLYAYMEVDDYHRAMKELETNPANRKWQAFMSDILAMDDKGDPKMYLIDEEVFHLE